MVKYYIQSLKKENWDKLKCEYKKERLNIYSYNGISVSPNDVVIIYSQEKISKDSGFVAYCKIKSQMKLNENKNKKIFTDLNISKYITELSEVDILNNHKLLTDIKSLIDATCKFKTLETFKNKFLKITSTLTEIPYILGQGLVILLSKEERDTYEFCDYDSDKIYEYEVDDTKNENNKKPEKELSDSSENISKKKIKKNVDEKKKSKKIEKKDSDFDNNNSDNNDSDNDSDSINGCGDLFLVSTKKSNIKKNSEKSSKSSKTLYSYDSKYDDSESEKMSISSYKKIKKDLFDVKIKRYLSDDETLSNHSDNETLSNHSDNETLSNHSDNKSEEETNDGNIPIILIPCLKFNHDKKNNDDKIKEFKIHYKTCDKCDKTNNNQKDIKEELDKHKIIYKKIDDIEEIDGYLDYYYNEKKYDHKLDDTIMIFKIENDDHDYHNAFIILSRNK
jgi:hypothetical protein